MSMTRKDFEAIAGILRDARQTMGTGAHVTLVSEFAEYLSTTNPYFDHNRFVTAAGVVKAPTPDDFPEDDDPHRWCAH